MTRLSSGLLPGLFAVAPGEAADATSAASSASPGSPAPLSTDILGVFMLKSVGTSSLLWWWWCCEWWYIGWCMWCGLPGGNGIAVGSTDDDDDASRIDIDGGMHTGSCIGIIVVGGVKRLGADVGVGSRTFRCSSPPVSSFSFSLPALSTKLDDEADDVDAADADSDRDSFGI